MRSSKLFITIMAMACLWVIQAQAQKTALSTVTNFRVAGGLYSFDVYATRTSTSNILVGTSNLIINTNRAGLNPIGMTITSINPTFTGLADHSGDYDPMRIDTIVGAANAGKVAVTIVFTGNNTGAGAPLALAAAPGTMICTVNLPIINAALTANLSWDIVNSGLTDSRSQPIVNSFAGSDNSVLAAVPTIDGTLADAQYVQIASKLNSNAGFGPNADVSKIVYYSDVAAQKLYIGVVGKLDIATNNAIGIWLNVTGPGSPVGKAAGQALGIAGGGSYIGNDGTHLNFKADFEVDYMFAFNPGNAATNVYFDAAKHVGSSVAEYQGTCNQTGTSTTNSNATGIVFPQNSITFAFDNSGAANKGLEMVIPWSAIGANGNMSIEVFAVVVSGSAFFSDVTVPGNVPPSIGDANPGFDADYSTLPGGPYHQIPPAPLPVQLSAFTAHLVNGQSVRLDWTTISEVSTYGFYIQKKLVTDVSYMDVPNSFVAGHGTTNTPHTYSFTDNTITPGNWQYRLKVQDLDGAISYSEPVQINGVTGVNEAAPKVFALFQNYPNPFNPESVVKFSVENTGHATLEVYSILGQKVATLFDDVAEAGRYYKVRIAGQNLASGTYIYRLQSGSHTDVKKMLLMK